jgi:CRISPR-associated protein Cas1
MSLTDDFKELLWQKITAEKIKNQARCLRLAGLKNDAEKLEEIAITVIPGDKNNREAFASQIYFKALFGSYFVRNDDDITNSALNYGYTIIRSAFCKTLVAYGYNCVLGIHHTGDRNPYNLADDMMEPLRPLVDFWTDSHCSELVDKLSRTNRNDIIRLVNQVIMWNGKKMRVRYAIDKYVSSLTTAINNNDQSKLKIPVLIPFDKFFEDELDG